MHKKFTKQLRDALDEVGKQKKHFRPKRKTTLVRIQKKWHEPLKDRARQKKKTLSKLHDEIYPFYFKHAAEDG